MNNNNKLRKLQLTELEILKKVDQVCRQYQINYFLIAGTLLGAVRHKGFIPWDDDIDIGMLRSDYEKFIDICLHKQALGKEYYLHCNESDEDYYLPFIKVKKNNTTFAEKCNENIDTHKGIFIDVFPYDNVPKPVSFLEKLQTFYTVNDCEYYLRKNFGDYMKLPPESERKSHLPLLISFTNGVNRTHEN